MEDGNEDDFWYQAPKMTNEGEYPGYGNAGLNSGGGNRKGPGKF